MDKLKVIVATHKAYWMPSDPMYYPLHVGHFGKKDIGFPGDSSGDNISEKNANFCELTGLYWMWKNLAAEYMGLVHYRRHFCLSKRTKTILTSEQAISLLNKADIVLPTPRNYWIETNYSQYVHAHHAIDLEITRKILEEKYPEYLEAYDRTMKRTYGHRFNMFIMAREKMDAYCTWLFDVLFELEKRLDISEYSPYDARVFGFVSERLLDIWLETNQYKYVECPYLFMEKQNWFVKIFRFLKRKFLS